MVLWLTIFSQLKNAFITSHQETHGNTVGDAENFPNFLLKNINGKH